MKEDAALTSEDTKSISLCAKMETLLVQGRKDEASESGAKVNRTKVTLADLTKFNHELVTGQESNKYTLRKYLGRERLYEMMKGGLLQRENSLWNYLHHFASERKRQIQRLNDLVSDEKQLEGPMTESFDANFLRDYFSDEREYNKYITFQYHSE